MFLPQFRDMEMESYDVEITTASRVTELFDDITATVVACQAMVEQIEGLVNLARMTVESGHRRWGMCLADWIQQDLAELDLMVDSLNDEGLKTERMAISERGRMMMYSHVLSSIADLRGSVECVIQAIEGMAETDIVDEKESGFAEIGPPYVRVCSLLPAYRFAHNSLSEDLSDDVWLSTMKVVTLMVRRMEDAMISVVSRSEWAADKSDPFYEHLRIMGRELTERSQTALTETYEPLIEEYNARLEWQVSSTLRSAPGLIRVAEETMIEPGDFAWGCQERRLPDGRIVLGDIFVLYAHGNKKMLQLPYEPYPENFSKGKVIAHVNNILESLVDLMLEELPEWYVPKNLERKLRVIQKAAEGGLHAVTTDMLAELVSQAARLGIPDLTLFEIVRKVALDDRDVLAFLCGFYRSGMMPSDDDLRSALGIRKSSDQEADSPLSADDLKKLSRAMKEIGFPTQSIETAIIGLRG